jgi:Zn-dependent protease with chaperone function
MSAPPVEAYGQPRLDPFAFASDTTLRFIFLFAFVIAAVIWRWHGIAVNSFDLGSRVQECLGGATLIGLAALSDLAKAQECYGRSLSYAIPMIVTGLLLLTAVTGAIYWFYPVWIVRRRGLTRFDPTDAPELFATLQKLCNTAELRHQPEFWWNPVSGRDFTLAFGRAGVHRVGFSGTRAVQHNIDPAAFRTIILHELGHIRNGDVWKTYMALSLGWGFLVAALLPYLVVVAASRQLDVADSAALLAGMAIATGIVLLTLIGVLRARELYADARSFVWGRDEETLKQVLGGLRPIEGLKRLISPHPDPARRQRLIHDTDQMFGFGFWDAFGAGAAASFIATTLAFVAGFTLFVARPESTAAVFAVLIIPIAFIVPLVAALLSIAIWRSTFLASMRGRRPDGVFRIACAMAAGSVLGGPVLYGAIVLQTAMGGAGHEYVDQIAGPWIPLLIGALALVVALIVVLAGVLVLFLKWVEAGATSWLSVAFLKPSPRVPFAIGILVTSVLPLAWFSLAYFVLGGTWFAQLEAGRSTALATFWRGLIASEIFPLNFIAWISLVAFLAFPLSAGLWRLRRHMRTQAEWPFADGVPRALPPVERSLYLRRALLIGVVGGLAAALMLQWLQIPLPLGALHDVGYPETAAAATLLSMTLTAIVVQGVIAALVVLAVPRLPIAHAMLAAFVAGWILATAEVLHLLGRGAAMDTALDLVLAPVVFGGALLALVAAFATFALRLPIYALLARRAARARIRHH